MQANCTVLCSFGPHRGGGLTSSVMIDDESGVQMTSVAGSDAPF